MAHLLVDVAAGRAPSVDGVVAANAINGRLTVDGEVPELVHLRELARDDRRFGRWRLRRPRKFGQVALTEPRKQLRDVGKLRRLSIQRLGLGGL